MLLLLYQLTAIIIVVVLLRIFVHIQFVVHITFADINVLPSLYGFCCYEVKYSQQFIVLIEFVVLIRIVSIQFAIFMQCLVFTHYVVLNCFVVLEGSLSSNSFFPQLFIVLFHLVLLVWECRPTWSYIKNFESLANKC